MRKLLLIAGIGALAIPAVALAQTDCLHQRQDNRVAGTLLGAGVGAAVGSAVAGPGERTTGAVVGGLSGAIVGHAAAGAATNCAAYTGGGYYDANGVWRQGPGFYDGNGRWVDTAPAPAAGDFSTDVAYTGPTWDTKARESWIEQRIHEGSTSGALGPGDADRDFGVLAGIRAFEAQRSDAHVGLTEVDRTDVMDRLDNLTRVMRSQWSY
ncbi:MAG TPA: glycine zipper 2TM domain-containing protein [Caulobacteraceae bacterium]|jgi:hypothetical protein